MARQEASSGLPRPLRAPVSLLGKVPGAGTVGRAAGGALDAVGRVSPRGRRLAVYTGAGVLGVAGVVEWPVALTGAAVAWLTQARQREQGIEGTGGTAAEAAGEAGAGGAARPERRPRGPEARRTTAGAMKSAAGGGIEARRSTAAARRPATGATRSAAGDQDRSGTGDTSRDERSPGTGRSGAGDTSRDERPSGTGKSGTGAARSAARSARAARSAAGHAAGNPAGRLTSRAGRVRMASGTSRPAHGHDR
ncbi:hypothetical protein [Streptomyces griseosporeus]|uniref:hypothetical protein n=1 Tax=Streptomyces griseosporeus TaxID=1910 RepID=UPI0037874341